MNSHHNHIKRQGKNVYSTEQRNITNKTTTENTVKKSVTTDETNQVDKTGKAEKTEKIDTTGRTDMGTVKTNGPTSTETNLNPVKTFKPKKTDGSKEDKDHVPVEDLEKYLNMDVRTGISKEAEKIAGNIFLTRGLNDLPEPENIHCRQYDNRVCKLPTYDWISKLDISLAHLEYPIAEVRFKNSHKDFFLLPKEGCFRVGDIVAVEAFPGHDIGIISMMGLQVKRQLAHKHIKPQDVVKKLYRTARYADIEKWIATVGLEHETMLSSRYTAWDLNLKMKVNDVEYFGDGMKAIFYYSSEERVDFRELIKILAEQFHIRIEMRQIGVRQEAARLGGIGSCGRELCCASWLTNFQSVSTNTARTQQLSLNPQKLAGMCGKLKCCLNFEQDTYQQELQEFPAPNISLKTQKGKCLYSKIDIFKQIVWYAYANDTSTIFAIPLDKAKQIIKMNAAGIIPEKLEDFAIVNQKKMDENNSYSLDELKTIEEE